MTIMNGDSGRLLYFGRVTLCVVSNISSKEYIGINTNMVFKYLIMHYLVDFYLAGIQTLPA